MKLIIDMPDKVWNKAKEKGDLDMCGIELYERVMNGIPYEERPKGEWIKDCEDCDCINCYESGARFTRKDCSGRCSVCGEYECCTDNFCPNCGADMRGKEE